jgi:hypothetical protein
MCVILEAFATADHIRASGEGLVDLNVILKVHSTLEINGARYASTAMPER